MLQDSAVKTWKILKLNIYRDYSKMKMNKFILAQLFKLVDPQDANVHIMFVAFLIRFKVSSWKHNCTNCDEVLI